MEEKNNHNDYHTFCDASNRKSKDKDEQYFTVKDAIEKLGLGRFQIVLSFVFGLCFLADCMEIVLVSILSSELGCRWRLTGLETTMIAAVFSLCFGAGAPLIGWMGDKFGRKKAVLFSGSWCLYFAVLSAWAPTYDWLIFLRGLCGLGVGMYQHSMVYYSEFLPQQTRGKWLNVLEFWFAGGGSLEVLLAMGLVVNGQWRWWLIASSVPLGLAIVACSMIPESPEFDVLQGKTDKAMDTLKVISRINNNGGTLPEGKIRPGKTALNTGRFQDLFSTPERTQLTLLLFWIWFAVEFLYFGIVFLATGIINSVSNPCHGSMDTSASHEESCYLDCKTLTVTDYKELLVTSLAELPAVALTTFMIDKVGRKWYMFTGLVLISLVCGLLLACFEKTITVLLLFLARGLSMCVISTVWVYTTEAYPTEFRGLAAGTCTAFGRAGLMVCPFVAQFLLSVSPRTCFTIFTVISMLATLAMFWLPFDTKDKKLV